MAQDLLGEGSEANWSTRPGPLNNTLRMILGCEKRSQTSGPTLHCRNHVITVWKSVASYYANESTIAGYDLLNEPMVYTSIIPTLNESNVNGFYNRTTEAIRAVDTNHIIFLEPASCMYTPNTMPDSRIVWEPHFYPLSFFSHYYFPEDLTVLEADLAAAIPERSLWKAKSPMWVGEFGAFMKDTGANNWLTSTKIYSTNTKLAGHGMPTRIQKIIPFPIVCRTPS